MPSKKRAKNKHVGLLLLLIFAGSLSACSDPPDSPACTAFPAIEWPAMRESFFKMCSDDPACAPRLDHWKKVVDTWSDPSDGGWCIQIVTGKSFYIDEEHPAPWKDKKGKPQKWKEIYASIVGFPAKVAWAPIKTWIQTNCRKTGKCPNGIGNWESTTDAIDKKVKK